MINKCSNRQHFLLLNLIVSVKDVADMHAEMTGLSIGVYTDGCYGDE